MLLTKRVLKLFVMSVLLLTSCNSKENAMPTGRDRQMKPADVDGFIVTHRSISDKIEVPGSLLPSEQTQIKSEVSGRIVKLNIQEGSVVQKGALLIKLYDGDLQTQLKKLQVQLQIAQKTQERQGELLKIN